MVKVVLLGKTTVGVSPRSIELASSVPWVR
jgi:hypothetical protein